MSKLTPYHQIGQIIKLLEKETELIPGKDVFITPRMVSSFKNESFRQLMTLVAVFESIHESTKFYSEPGIREMVHAMTTIEELKQSQNRARSILRLLSREIKFAEGSDIQIIPLFEGVPELLSIKSILPQLAKELGSNVFS
jgi:phosphoenolpyruvate carboxylase